VNHRPKKVFVCEIVSVLAILTLAGCDSDSIQDSALLSEFSVQGSTGAIYPQFDPQISHYAAKCAASDVLTLTATAEDPAATISADGEMVGVGTANFEIASPASDQDIRVDVLDRSAASTYTFHCLDEEFPDVQVLKADAGTTQDLLMVTPGFRVNSARKSFLLILDNNGVPRFRRKLDARSFDFKRQVDGMFSYMEIVGRSQFGIADSVAVLMDEEFNEVEQARTVGLTQTDFHDFLITDEGNRLFISYNSSARDMTAFGLAADEIVGDSVIQEVTPGGQVVFQWDSWDHIDLADCEATGYPRFPSDYAHLNSLDLTPDGDIIASFRGCGQVLKIDRPTGEVIWRLGGSMSDFTIVGDPFNEFCGQHTALEIAPDRILMFDNGVYCLGDRENVSGQFSRVVEYRLDMAAGQANFVRDHSLNGTYQELTGSQGAVQLLENGNWLISWGNGPDMSITEVDQSGKELFAMKILVDGGIAVTYRAYREPNLPAD